MKAKPCENCNSEIIMVKRNDGYVAECSYCGQPADFSVGVDFTEDYEDEE